MRKKNRFGVILFFVGLLLVLWFGYLLAGAWVEGNIYTDYIKRLSQIMEQPFSFAYFNRYTPVVIFIFVLTYLTIVFLRLAMPRNLRVGKEHGSARLASPEEANRALADKNPANNMILTEHVRLSFNAMTIRRNLNTIMVAASGRGKTYEYVGPNLLNDSPCSWVITDPKKEVLRKYGYALSRFGFRIRVLDLMDFAGDRYNPFVYLHKQKDVVRMVTRFLKNTTPKNAMSSDPFWEKAETTLWLGLFLFVWQEYPPKERTFPRVLDLLNLAVQTDPEQPSELQRMVKRVARRKPGNLACRLLRRVLYGAADTVASILQMAFARATLLEIEEVREMLSANDIAIEELGFGVHGDGKTRTALFLCIPDDDPSYNFLAGMFIDQLFQELKLQARKKNHGTLPLHVRLMVDEAAQIPFTEELVKTVSVIRGFNISINLIYQDLSQLEEQFKNGWKTMLQNMDHLLYFGGNEKDTNQYMSDMLDEETIDKRTLGQTYSTTNGSSSRNFDTLGRHLMTRGEIREMPYEECLLYSAGIPPVRDTKYPAHKHPNYHLSANDDPDLEYDYTPVRFQPVAGAELLLKTEEIRQTETYFGEEILVLTFDELIGMERDFSDYTTMELYAMAKNGTLSKHELIRLKQWLANQG